jgi:hypothetical protein
MAGGSFLRLWVNSSPSYNKFRQTTKEIFKGLLMFINVMGKIHNLGEAKPDPSVREYTFTDLIKRGLNENDRKIINIMKNSLITNKATATAALLFSIPEHAVTEAQKEVAKQRNFSVLYGVSE